MSRYAASAILLVSLGLAAPASGGEPGSHPARSSFGLRSGYMFTTGKWQEARVAPGVAMFGGSAGVGADLEIAVSGGLSIAADSWFTSLNGSAWENYVASKGGHLTSEASMICLGLLLRPHIPFTEDDLLKIELGPAVMFPSGSEWYNSKTYTYDFFSKTAFGVEGGMEYVHILGARFALSARLSVWVFPSGLEYADGESRTVVSLPATVGFRLLF